ncbi:unnamed protein product, partial [Prunus brigantina]
HYGAHPSPNPDWVFGDSCHALGETKLHDEVGHPTFFTMRKMVVGPSLLQPSPYISSFFFPPLLGGDQSLDS